MILAQALPIPIVPIPWTQVVIASCAVITALAVLVGIFHKMATSSMRKDIELIMTNHLPHVEDKIDMVLAYLKIPHVPRDRQR